MIARRPSRLKNTDIRGAVRLATDAAAGLADLVEAMHARIVRVPGSGASDGRTSGITGLVYGAIRGVTRVVGGSIDALLGLLAPALGPEDSSREREATVAALNGVLGDYLVASGNPLATAMGWHRDGRRLSTDAGALASALPDATGRVVILLHGLCMNELQWSRTGHDHGAALARDCGYTPVYLRYNSGLHISINGRALAREIELLLAGWPRSIERLAIVGHSMGGLLARSAFHYASQAGMRWSTRLDDLVFLGTPHHGAPLERAGHWVDVILDGTPYAGPLSRLGKVRSAGITDLRFGNLVDEDWVGRDRFARSGDRRQRLALPAGVRSFTIAGTIGKRSGDLKDRLLGDGLVPLDSALGRHRDPARSLAFGPDGEWTGYGLTHLDLLNSNDVYAQLRRRLD